MEALVFRSYGNTWNNNFSSCNWKKHKLQILLLKWLIFILDKELAGEQEVSPWESYYLPAVSKTSCQPAIKKKKKKKTQIFYSTALHHSGERREVINGMLRSRICLGPSRKFAFGKTAFWGMSCWWVGFTLHWVLCRLGWRPTQRWWLASNTGDFPWAIGTEYKTGDNREYHWKLLLLELIISWCTPQLQFG